LLFLLDNACGSFAIAVTFAGEARRELLTAKPRYIAAIASGRSLLPSTGE
jgi:hypothetical protein